jgi:hypothetical protein
MQPVMSKVDTTLRDDAASYVVAEGPNTKRLRVGPVVR